MKVIYEQANLKTNQAYVYGGDIEIQDPDSLTLIKQFEKNLEQNGEERVYFYDVEGKVSSTRYNEIKNSSLKILGGLSKRSVRPQEMVIFQCGSSEDFIHTFWACMYGGIIPVLANLPKDLDNITDLDSLTIYNIWKMVDKAKIVVSNEIYDQYVRFAEKIGIDVNCLINIDSLYEYEAIAETYETQPESIAMMFFTSGSTGVPKGVLQTHKAAVLREYGQIQLNNSQKDVLLNWMPLEHAAGVLMAHIRGVMLGSTQIQVETDYILSNPLRWLDLIDKHQINFSWAPHFAYVLIDELAGNTAGEWDLSSINSLINAGEMVQANSGKKFLKSLEKYGLKSNVMHPVWGMSETCSGVLYNLDFDDREYSGTQLVSKDLNSRLIANSAENANVVTEIGTPVPGCAVKIVDQKNRWLPTDTIGRVLIKGEPVTKGYFKNEAANKESFTDGWFITGDLGFIHDGKVILTGREKDIIIVNGLNYNNVEVEAIIEEDGRVEKSFTAVCAVTDPDTQLEEVIAFLVPRNDGQDIVELTNEIKRHVLVKLNLKINYIIPVKKGDIPKTNLEKIQRSKLGKQYLNGEFDSNEVFKSDADLLDKIEVMVSEEFGIRDMAVVLNESNRKLDAVPISELSDGLTKTEIVNEQYRVNPNASKQVIQTLADIEGVQKLHIGWRENLIERDSSEPIVFFKTGLKDFHFNILVLKKIRDLVINELNYKDCTLIPISCISYLDTKDLTGLLEAYKQGQFIDLLKDIDKELLNANTLPQWFYEEKLVTCEAIESNYVSGFSVVFVNDVEIMDQLIQVNHDRLKQIVFLVDEKSKRVQNAENLNIEFINVFDKDTYKSALKKWCENQGEIDVIHLAGCETYEIDSLESLEKSQYKTVVSIQNVIQALGAIDTSISRFLVMTKNTLAIENAYNHNYAISTVSGFVKATADEGHTIKHIELDSASVNSLTEIIKSELETKDNLTQVVYRQNKRHKISIQKIDIHENIKNTPPLVQSGFYLITGGLGGIGVNIAQTLMDRFQANIVLTGRTNIIKETNSEKNKSYKKIKLLEENGSEIFYESCDLTNDIEITNVIEHYEKKFGQTLNGVIHLAGGITEQLVENQNVEELFSVYDAKVFGTYVLAKAVADREDAIYVTTSSARSLMPGMTVSAYCSASEFNAHLSGYIKNHLNVPAYCISWSQWDEIGMGKGLVVKNVLEEKGFKSFLKEQGQNSFLMALKFRRPYVYVGLDQTKEPMRKLILDQAEPQQEIQVFTSYQNVLNKESEFVSFVKQSIDSLEELIGITVDFRFVYHLPLDKNGLVDKSLLTDRMDVLLGETKIIKPRNEYEQKVYDAWRKAFKNIDFGVTDHFFNLGGDSIKIIQLISMLKSTFNVPIKNQDIFRLITIEQQAEFFKNKYKTNETQVPVETSIKTRDVENVEKGNIDILSAPQKRQWVLYKLNPDSPYYNNTAAINVAGTILLPCLKMAIYQLIERHESLRTRFGEKGGQFYQFIDESIDLSIEEVNLEAMDEVEKAGTLEELYFKEANKVIHIGQEIPIRATIITIGTNEAILLISIHHIASDGWSMGVLLQDLSAIYSDIITTGRSKLPALTKQYINFATWQHQFMKSTEYESQLQYWKEELENAPPALELPFDMKRTDEIQNKGKRISFEIDKEVTGKLKAICKEKNCTLYMLLMSAFSTLMHRYSNQEDMIVGTLIANRNQAELEKMIGFFVNTMPIRLNVETDMPFDALLEQVKEKTLKMYDHQDVPFDAMIDELGVERESGKNPIFQTLFVVQNAQLDTVKDEHAEWNLSIMDSDTSKFDFITQVFEIDNKLFVKFEYDTSIFHEETIQRWSEQFKRLVTNIANDQTQEVGNYDILTVEEKQMIGRINETSTDYAASKSIYELFGETVASHPNKIAVSVDNQKVSFAQLKEKVDRLAAHVSNLGIKHQENVVIVADKSIETIVGMLAILKIGAAYVPVSRNYPKDFLEYIIEDCQSEYLLCKEKLEGFEHVKQVMINQEFEEPIKRSPYSVGPQDKAYVMYTSGSTGKPKGVIVTHRNIIRLISQTNIIEFKEEDVILQTGSITFDASTFEIWGSLLNGIELHLVDEDVLLDIESLRLEMNKSKVTIMWVSAPLFNQLVETDEMVFKDVRTLLIGGDVVSPKMTNKVRKHLPEIEIINGYGPTENTTFSTFFKIDENYDTPIPIGKPIANSTAYIVNEKMQLQPFGVVGELVVGGDGVAEGYLNKPELTEKQFITNPFDSSGRLYKTGDYARLSAKGNIEFVGRIDKQIKIRGFRIELQAIEQAIGTISGVDRVLVSCVEVEENKRIVAYYTGQTGLGILAMLDEMLPNYMLPHHIVHMNDIPLNRNGKVDHSKLPKEFESKEESIKQSLVLPETDNENIVFEIWKEILKTDAFGITDNFFKLGGDSIMVIQLTNMIKKKGYHVTTKVVFQNQTIRSLAGQLTKIETIVEEETVTGEGELGPIQQWFFDQDLKNKHFWNLPLMIHFEKRRNSEVIHKALHEVVIYHDSLHSTFVDSEQAVVQVFGDNSVNVPFEIVDLTDVTNRTEVIKRKSVACQEKINIQTGPLVSAVLFNDVEEQHLFIGVHHLVVDGISLRIIGEDLLEAVEQIENYKQIQLQSKSASFKQWTEKLKEYANSKQAMLEYDYWKEINDKSKNLIDLEGINRENTSQTKQGILDQKTTDLLLKKAGLNVGAEINDLLLAALYKTFTDLFGINSLSLKLEGHGREDIIQNVDLSRTVGWFTTAYPVLLESENDESIENIVLDVKDTLRKIPNKGIGYGVLKYLSDQEDVSLDFEPEISFNYLGNFDERMEVGSREYGIFHDESAARDVVIDFNIVLFKGEMNIYLTLHDQLIEEDRFKVLLERYIQNVKSITQHCTQLEDRVYSASDYPLANLRTGEVQNVISSYQGKVKDLYSLSVAQKGMLYHYLMNPSSEEYFGQIHCHLYGTLNKDIFTEAWNHVTRNNSILSTVYKWGEVEDPIQIVLENEGLDVRYINAKESGQMDEDYLEGLLQEDKENLFDLTALPIIRVMVVEMEQHTEFVFSFHHISLDGWSVFVILGEVIEAYKKLTNGEEVFIDHDKGHYKDYIEWLQRQDKVELASFWSLYMEGFEEKTAVWGILPEEEETAEGEFRQQAIELTETEEIKLSNRSEELGVTVSTLIQSALAITLHKFSGSNDIVFGTTVSGRDPEIENVNSISGLLINTIPLRIQLDVEAEINDYIQSVQQNAFEINNYHMLSMAEIKSVSDIDRLEDFFDVLLIFENYPIAKQVSDRNYKLSFGPFESHERTNYALTIVAVPEETLKIRFSYMKHRIDEDILRALMKGMKTILMKLCTSDDTVSKINLYEENYEHNVIHEWSHNMEIESLYEDQEEIYSVVMNSKRDAQIYILDEDLMPTPLGIPGEVYIGIHDLNLIESDWTDWMMENKIVNELSSDSYDYLYKTGDIGMWISKKKIRLLE